MDLDKQGSPTVTTPTEPGPTTITPTSLDTNASSPKKRFSLRGGKKLPLIVAGVGALLLGGGAYGYFGVYLQDPGVVWNQAMNKTAAGLEALDKKSQENQKEGGKITGNFRVEKPIVVDGSIDSKFHKKDSVTKLDVGFGGSRVNLEARTIQADGAKTPDIYVNATGLNSMAGLLGLAGENEISSMLSQIEGKWYMVDHTLLDQAVAQAESSEQSTELTAEDIKDIQTKFVAVVNDYFFTSDESKAVLTKGKFIGKEDFEGTSSFRYETELHKDKFRDFVVALKDAAKTTKLKDMLETGGRSFEENISFESVLKGIDEADFSKVKIEVWVAKGTKLIRNVRFTPTDLKDGETVYFDVGLDYKGGDEMTFKFAVVGSDNESQGHITTILKVNRESLVSDLNVQFDIDYKADDGRDSIGQVNLKIEPSDDHVDVQKPDGATNIMELLGSFYGGFQQQSSLDELTVPDFDFSEL